MANKLYDLHLTIHKLVLWQCIAKLWWPLLSGNKLFGVGRRHLTLLMNKLLVIKVGLWKALALKTVLVWQHRCPGVWKHAIGCHRPCFLLSWAVKGTMQPKCRCDKWNWKEKEDCTCTVMSPRKAFLSIVAKVNWGKC